MTQIFDPLKDIDHPPLAQVPDVQNKSWKLQRDHTEVSWYNFFNLIIPKKPNWKSMNLVIQDPRILQRLYDEYLVCGGDWLNSSIVQTSSQSTSLSNQGAEKYVTFQELSKRYGEKIAKQIRAEKRKLQSEMPKDSKDAPFVMDHPDLPEVEDQTYPNLFKIMRQFFNMILGNHG